MSNNDIILEVKNLHTYFNTDAGVVKAVNGVSYDLKKGEILGIVGESGSGKSVSSLSIMKLIPTPPGKIVDGEVLFDGRNLLEMNEKELRTVRGDKIAMIFQDPMTSLNPFLKISTQLMETIMLHQKLKKVDARAKAIEMLTLVGIPSPDKRIDNYPHQFSGGMRQRVMIAIALSCNPEVLIADEPTTALDVTIQAQILDLIKDLSKRLNTAVIMITHDLGVVAGMCDTVSVMYAGKIVEKSANDKIFNNARHPYTEGLIKSVPRLDVASRQKLFSIDGQPPNVIDLPECCPFHPRCEKAMDKCRNTYPPVVEYDDGSMVRCWLYEGDK